MGGRLAGSSRTGQGLGRQVLEMQEAPGQPGAVSQLLGIEAAAGKSLPMTQQRVSLRGAQVPEPRTARRLQVPSRWSQSERLIISP